MTTSTSLVYLIALPLAGAALLLLGGRRTDKWGHLLATALSASSFGVGLYQLSQMLGRSTKDLAAALGAEYERELVHRDDLVLL